MKQRYRILRFVGGVYEVLALLTAFGTVLAAFAGTPYGSILTLLIGGGVAVSLFAAGEVIFVFLGIEENTRRQADAMERWTTPPRLPPAP